MRGSGLRYRASNVPQPASASSRLVIGDDQVASYARRKGRPIEEVERWLGANLSYEPLRC